MTWFEMAFLIVSTLVAVVALAYLVWLLRTSGRDRIDDPNLVERFRETAPIEKLDQVLDPPEDE